MFNDTASEFSTAVNVGPETLPNTYSFARNRWLNLANPTAAGSTPVLPVAEVGGTYGVDPVAPTNAAVVWDFAWGKWVVNANATQQSVEVPSFASLRRATAGASAAFHPLENDPLVGAWTSATIPASTLQLPAFSQVILIDPAACPNCVSVSGDYDQNGVVNALDYNAWRTAYGAAIAAADGNLNGVVDAADYVIWRSAMAAVGASTGQAAVIPEPAPSHLMALAMAIVAALRTCR